MMQDDLEFTAMTVVCGFLLLICVFGFISSVKESTAKANYLKDNECALVSTEETGDRRYCGKACTRPELKKTYSCKTGTTIIVE